MIAVVTFLCWLTAPQPAPGQAPPGDTLKGHPPMTASHRLPHSRATDPRAWVAGLAYLLPVADQALWLLWACGWLLMSAA